MGNIFITCPVLLVFPEDYSAQPIVLSSKDISGIRYCSHAGKKRNTMSPKKRGNQEGLKITLEEGH